MTDGVTHSSIEEQLALCGVVYTTTSGDSMRPLFRTHRNMVKLVAYHGTAQRDDVILWRDASGKYLLHRVVRVTDDGYITRGDNYRHEDPPVKREQVIATLAGYYKKEKFISCASRRYRAYVRTWGRPHFIRNMVHWLRDVARRIVGKQPKR